MVSNMRSPSTAGGACAMRAADVLASASRPRGHAGFVHPEYRGDGRGTAITRAAIEAAGDVRDLWIVADDEDRPKELYARLGFRAAWTTISSCGCLDRYSTCPSASSAHLRAGGSSSGLASAWRAIHARRSQSPTAAAGYVCQTLEQRLLALRRVAAAARNRPTEQPAAWLAGLPALLPAGERWHVQIGVEVVLKVAGPPRRTA